MPFLRRKMTSPSIAAIMRMSPHELMSTSLPGIHAQSISLLKCAAESSKRNTSPFSVSVKRFALTTKGAATPPFSGVAAIHLRRCHPKGRACSPQGVQAWTAEQAPQGVGGTFRHRKALV